MWISLRDNTYKESAPYGGLRQLLEIFLKTVPSRLTRHLPTHMPDLPVVFANTGIFFCCTFTYIKKLPVNIYRHYFSCLEKQIVPFILLILYPLDFKDCMMMLVKGFTNFKAGTKMHLSLQKNLDPSQETRFWEKKESIDLQCTNCITYSKIYSKSKPEFCFGNAESKWQRCKGLQLSWHGG